MQAFVEFYKKIGLIPAIVAALIIGTIIGVVAPNIGAQLAILGDLFIGALKGVAPILVLILVVSAICSYSVNSGATKVKSVMLLYVVGTLMAAVTAVLASFVFPVALPGLGGLDAVEQSAPQTLAQVLHTLLMNLVDNPVNALVNANYMGILMWSALFGFALRAASDTTKSFTADLSYGITKVVQWIIQTAPLGILGIVASTIAQTGLSALMQYAQLLLVLLCSMLFIALVGNAIIVYAKTGKNPYPLVLTCLKESAITAFFTRSSAANIPVNMALAKKLGLNEDTYSVCIPLGATINMAGAAITINVLTLAAAHTLGVEIGFFQAVLLSIVGAISACGASGVPGGSLLLIPLACSLLNIPNDIAMQVVGIGFIIGVVQDSAETALNSSTDVLFTAAADPMYARK